MNNTEKDIWLKQRESGIGGSDVSVLFGMNPFRTVQELYLDKIGEGKEIIETPAMKAGVRLEPVVVDMFEEHSGFKCTTSPFLTHPEYPFIVGSPDRIILDSAGNGILECKTTNGFTWRKNNGQCPEHYQLQLQHYMLVSGLTWGSIAVLVDGKDFYVFDYAEDKLLQEQIIDKCKEFWTKVESRTAPNEPVIAPISPATGVLVAEERLRSSIENLDRIEAQLAKFKEDAEALNNEIQARLIELGCDVIVDEEGKQLITWKKSAESSIFNATTFKKDHPELYKAYIVVKEGTRRFLRK